MQTFITISQKGRKLLDNLVPVYGGTVRPSNKSASAFKWTVSKKSDVLGLIDNYFHWNKPQRGVCQPKTKNLVW